MKIVVCGYDDPVAKRLVAQVQQEYVARYGSEDETPTDPADFTAPLGHFVVGWLDGEPVACGGWRGHDGEPNFLDGDAELKRMYVAERARGRGLARALLADLERSALERGRRRMVLETGINQPEAIALYTSSGYLAIPKFGFYSGSETSRCYGKDLSGGLV
ncbi:GNAT family N-acetyltransferase [Actinomadura barringtoniae]|uniref:GNAT family N-acetyltransferase n=1 Tax=Actinomadura barringtoniae TaxID=1427535 RepID=A0A939PLQ0_9ACTN|nr:GNAT family N-acetyltransferase [Actinomadura barringtoniae]MBO2452358.1 GNAT family N-acetyltransferase [Actinomadura barringtoniae]